MGNYIYTDGKLVTETDWATKMAQEVKQSYSGVRMEVCVTSIHENARQA